MQSNWLVEYILDNGKKRNAGIVWMELTDIQDSKYALSIETSATLKGLEL